jgi:hypothetical protein
MRKLILAFVVTIMAASLAAADTITLRDGRTVHCTVLGFVNGRFAVRLTEALEPPATVQTEQQSNRTRFTGSGEVGDIIFIHPRSIQRMEIEGRNLADARYVMRTVRVELGPNWVDTGVDLQRGETVRVRAGNYITITTSNTRITPAGISPTTRNLPLPGAPEGALIGSIGDDPNSPIFLIGEDKEFTADRDGRLYLTANRQNYNDASRAFTARIYRDIRTIERAGGNRNDDNFYDNVFEPDSTQTQTGRVRRRERTTEGQPPLPDNGTGGSTGRGPREVNITIPGTSRGTDTGLDVRVGDQVTVTATGTVTAGRRVGDVSPDGGRVGFGSIVGTYPVANLGVGALIGYIRTPNGQITQPFAVGSSQSLNVPVEGRLFLLINDNDYSDNAGQFNVRLVITPSQTTQPGSDGTGGLSGSQGYDKYVQVSANSRETDTGIDLRAGDRISFSAGGSVYSRGTDAISPEGNRYYDKRGENYPMRDAAFGSLVGYIRTNYGQTRPFYIGSTQTITVPESGRLILMINDNDYSDNNGFFRVRVFY